MKSTLSIIKEDINLESYSFSEGFIGYYEKNTAYSSHLCSKAIDLLFNKPFFNASHLTIASNLFIVGDDNYLRDTYGFKERELHDNIYPLVSYGLLTRMTSSQDCTSRLDGDCFSVKTCLSIDVIRKISFTVMSIEGVRGHCFIFSPDSELILYPHEDLGYGFITTSNDPAYREYLKDSLLQQFARDGFEVKVF